MPRITKADAARQLGISRTTLYKLIDQGKLSATPAGPFSFRKGVANQA